MGKTTWELIAVMAALTTWKSTSGYASRSIASSIRENPIDSSGVPIAADPPSTKMR